MRTALQEQELIVKAWKDTSFKDQLVREPKSTLEQYIGTRLPDSVQVYVHLEDEENIHVRLPVEDIPGGFSDNGITSQKLEDTSFKDQLVREPKSALEQYIGTRLPDSVQVHVHLEDEENIHLCLPSNPTAASRTDISEFYMKNGPCGQDNTEPPKSYLTICTQC